MPIETCIKNDEDLEDFEYQIEQAFKLASEWDTLLLLDGQLFKI